MKRCIECGYRAKADIKNCPLCEGKMVKDTAEDNDHYHAQAHKEEGAPCLLEQKPSKHGPFKGKSENKTVESRWFHASAVPTPFILILIVLLVVLTQSCSG